ncbi:hypothetical protein NDU88_003505 [Pleurodeles waltl]|uniref:Uncharacterized protein n=1 Tax=Pleurodeles waltl TaxID=8319 RepID=A0AAV7T5Z8_PLEWA|nr:hypothetical protein NDU88_003505 [Pleurodeles waltl]
MPGDKGCSRPGRRHWHSPPSTTSDCSCDPICLLGRAFCGALCCGEFSLPMGCLLSREGHGHRCGAANATIQEKSITSNPPFWILQHPEAAAHPAPLSVFQHLNNLAVSSSCPADSDLKRRESTQDEQSLGAGRWELTTARPPSWPAYSLPSPNCIYN